MRSNALRGRKAAHSPNSRQGFERDQKNAYLGKKIDQGSENGDVVDKDNNGPNHNVDVDEIP